MIINPYRTPGESRIPLPRLAAASVTASVGSFILPLLISRRSGRDMALVGVVLGAYLFVAPLLSRGIGLLFSLTR
jgi:hypothetical protein